MSGRSLGVFLEGLYKMIVIIETARKTNIGNICLDGMQKFLRQFDAFLVDVLYW